MIKNTAKNLMSVMFRFRNFKGDIPENLGLKLPELFALKMISDFDINDNDNSCSSLEEIRNELNFTKSATSQLMNSLEEKGFVTREINPDDRRKVEVKLTSLGADKLMMAELFKSEMLEEVIKDMGEDKVNDLVDLLTSFSNSLDKVNHKLNSK
jgi:DNA-binding MarR family transcriptional regulator